jgi:UDPglucose 6-dehydrogenase
MRINTEQRLQSLKNVNNAVWTLRGKKPAVLGRAFKGHTDDVREGVVYANDPYEAAANFDALLILTEWGEFANLNLRRICSFLKHSIAIDGPNLYQPEPMTS